MFFWGMVIGIFLGGVVVFVCFALLALSDEGNE